MTDTEERAGLARPSSLLRPPTEPVRRGSGSPADVLRRFRELESSCDRYRLWGATSVPAPLQTPAYLRAYVELDRMIPAGSLPDDQAEALARRQATRRENVIGRAPVTVVLGESAIRARVGGPDGLREQVAFLRELDARDDVDVLVLPRTVVPPPVAALGDFTMVNFPGHWAQRPTVFRESHGAAICDPDRYDLVDDVFEQVTARCVPLRTLVA